MSSLLWRAKNNAPNARQLFEYTGETGFSELRFSKGRGRSAGVVINSTVELYRFLRNGEFNGYKSCRVLLPGQRVKQTAKVVVTAHRTQLIAGNGMIVAEVPTVLSV